MPNITCDQQCIEFLKGTAPFAVPALAGFVGVITGAIIGAWLTNRRERSQRRLAFVDRQLKDFYSPILGLRNEIRTRSKLRARFHDAATTAWRDLCAQTENASIEIKQALSRDRGPTFKRLIEYDNTKFQEDLLPAYLEMIKLFREHLALAEQNTQQHYEPLIEFVEIWERYLAESIPVEVIILMNHSEENLNPLYAHIEQMHDELRRKVKDGKV